MEQNGCSTGGGAERIEILLLLRNAFQKEREYTNNNAGVKGLVERKCV